jgi:hypothetical protein
MGKSTLFKSNARLKDGSTVRCIFCYAECRDAECRYADCCYAECLFVILESDLDIDISFT